MSVQSIIMALLTALLLGSGVISSCTSAKQQDIISEQERQIAEVTAERTALAQSLHLFEAARSVESAVLRSVSISHEYTATRARHAERQTKEAMRRETTINFKTVLSRDVSDAFCLRYLTAAGLGESTSSDSPKYTDGPTPDTYATKRDARLASECAAWEGLTLGDVFEWTGLLLDHAGAERVDKHGLREWSRRMRIEEGE